MKALDHKLWRDLWRMKTQALAISLVMACGVATFVMSLCMSDSLHQTLANYYDSRRFADLFLHVKRAPKSLVPRLAQISGVAKVEPRITAAVTLDLPQLDEPANGFMVSVPDHGEPALNLLHLRRGRMPELGRRHEVVLNEAFAEANKFAPGDSLRAIINGRLETLAIVGIALSPEFVYQIRPGEIFPDDKRYGVLWMREEALAAAMDLTGAFNDAVVRLARGANEAAVITALDQATAPYGGQGAYGREDQVSHRFVTDELSSLRAMATVPPAIFLGVAAFLLNVVLSRIVRTEREQIAALKALGYTNREVGSVYLRLTLLIVGAGVLLGIGLGAWLGHGLTKMYIAFFRFPTLEFHLSASVLAGATLISSAAGMIGVFGAVRRAVHLPPAEAMRPEPPAQFRETFVERTGLQRFLPQASRIILRQIERQPLRALLSCAGIAFSVAVFILGSFTKDVVDELTEVQFFTAQRQDVTFNFTEPSSAQALHHVEHLPGMQRAEPFRNVAVRLRAGHRSKRISITGLSGDGTLYRLIDIYNHSASLPDEGLVLSKKLAETLRVQPGDLMTVEVLEGQRPVRQVAVASLLDDFNGLASYMKLSSLNRLLQEGHTISGVYATLDPLRTKELFREVKAAPRVAGTSLKRAALDSFYDTMSENLLRMRFINVIFASVIAFGVVYNSARVSLSERSRELATLRVIGFTRSEVSRILLGELAILTVAAIPLGLVIGHGFAAAAMAGLETRTQRFPFVIAPATYGTAVVVTILAVIISAWIVRRRIRDLDLVAVLKARE